MDAYVRLAGRIAPVFLRFTLGIVLLWIGALKFADPAPVVGLLQASLSFLAFPAVVSLLGVLEVGSALLLFFGVGLRYVALLLVGLFAGTLTIFVIAPSVSYGEAGFPWLALPGKFLLKDLVLMASAIALVALDGGRTPAYAA